ncbi:MAG: exostosin family protein [Verrucomicrobiota bacterium]
MAKVLLLSTADKCDDGSDYNRGAFLKLQQSASIDIFHDHQLTDDPESADLILFAELYGAGDYFDSVKQHPLVKKFREKCFLFCSNDFVIPLLPGIYASIERRWSSARTRSGFYLGVFENEFVEFAPPTNDLKYLYSFIGNCDTAPIRRKLGRLVHPRSLYVDTSAEYPDFLYNKLTADQKRAYSFRYTEICKASKFILCPRGFGASSVRLFDAMRMGRVPVILSDQWVPPAGPKWEKFSLRLPEREFTSVPELLERHEPSFIEMAKLARAQWEEWFSEGVCFHRVVEWCLDIKTHRHIPERVARFSVYIQFLRPFHFRHFLRTKYRAWQKKRRADKYEVSATT